MACGGRGLCGAPEIALHRGQVVPRDAVVRVGAQTADQLRCARREIRHRARPRRAACRALESSDAAPICESSSSRAPQWRQIADFSLLSNILSRAGKPITRHRNRCRCAGTTRIVERPNGVAIILSFRHAALPTRRTTSVLHHPTIFSSEPSRQRPLRQRAGRSADQPRIAYVLSKKWRTMLRFAHGQLIAGPCAP